MKPFVFKIYTYNNGLNQTVICAKWVNRFWLDSWVTIKDLTRGMIYENTVARWNSREEAINSLREMCERITSAQRARDFEKKKDQLRLVLIDKVEIAPSEVPSNQ